MNALNEEATKRSMRTRLAYVEAKLSAGAQRRLNRLADISAGHKHRNERKRQQLWALRSQNDVWFETSRPNSSELLFVREGRVLNSFHQHSSAVICGLSGSAKVRSRARKKKNKADGGPFDHPKTPLMTKSLLDRRPFSSSDSFSNGTICYRDEALSNLLKSTEIEHI